MRIFTVSVLEWAVAVAAVALIVSLLLPIDFVPWQVWVVTFVVLAVAWLLVYYFASVPYEVVFEWIIDQLSRLRIMHQDDLFNAVLARAYEHDYVLTRGVFEYVLRSMEKTVVRRTSANMVSLIKLNGRY